MTIYGGLHVGESTMAAAIFVLGVVLLCIGWIPFLGLKILRPQEALVLTLFGKYAGTLKGDTGTIRRPERPQSSTTSAVSGIFVSANMRMSPGRTSGSKAALPRGFSPRSCGLSTPRL